MKLWRIIRIAKYNSQYKIKTAQESRINSEIIRCVHF